MKNVMNKIIPIGISIGITIIIVIIAGNYLVQDQTEFVGTGSELVASVSQQDLKEMVENWMNNPDEDDTNQRLEIMKSYYIFEETGQKLTQDREGLTLMNQIRKMVSLDIPKTELDQIRNNIREELRESSLETECSIQCLVYDPVCGEDGITYACGVKDAACHNAQVKYQGECNALSETKILYVDSKLVDCIGVSPQQCMLVKENPNSDWHMFYDKIQGFDYQEGTQYQLEVMITNVENPPADSSSLQYTLVRMLDPLIDSCELKPDVGLCKAYIPRYYFDETSNSCQEFIWGGCDGTVPFETMKSCTQQCEN